jgi:hypothetical protein
MTSNNLKAYKTWIVTHYPNQASAYGNCKQAVDAMKAAFPELEIACGKVDVLGYPHPRDHWWLRDADGDIVDPTAVQFPLIMGYAELDADAPERRYPRMKCMNCGESFLASPEDGKYAPACSEACSNELEKSYG